MFSLTAGAPEVVAPTDTVPPVLTEDEIEDVARSVQEQVRTFTVTLAELRAVFSSHLLQSVVSYFTWFSVYAWTVTSYFGMFYYTYLVRS